MEQQTKELLNNKLNDLIAETETALANVEDEGLFTKKDFAKLKGKLFVSYTCRTYGSVVYN